MFATLYNKNSKALDVEIENGKIIKIGEIYNKEKLPLCLYPKLDLESINKWLNKRKMPLEREGLNEVMKTFGSSYYQNYNNMFSLTDQYWFKVNKKDSWKKLNFFTNSYSSEIGQSLFSPWSTDIEKIKNETPDLTTNGVLRKVWVQDPETLTSYLIKAGSKKYYQQPLSEALATLTLRKMGKFIPYVKYDLYVNGLRVCSKCKNFVNEHTEFIPAQSVFNLNPRRQDKSQYAHFLLQCYQFGIKNPDEFIDKMLFVDAIIGNTDRHMGNFGFIKDVDQDKVLGFAPLFDFGSAFREFHVNKEEKPRLFGEQLPRVYQKFGRLQVLRELEKTNDLFSLIDIYPDLTIKEKDAIKEGINKRIDFLANVDNFKSISR